MFGIPFLTPALIIRGIIVLVVAIACFVVYEKVEHWCNKACVVQTERADGIQAKWDAAVTAQKAREAAAAKQANEDQRRADAERKVEFDRLLAKRTAEIQARLAARPASIDLSRSLSDATRAANGEGARKSAEADPTPATVPNELAVAEWFDQVAMMYRACRERVAGWVKWDDARVQQ